MCGDPPVGLSNRMSIDAPCFTAQPKTGGPLGVAVEVGAAGEVPVEALGLGPPGPQETTSAPAATASTARPGRGVTRSGVYGQSLLSGSRLSGSRSCDCAATRST